MNIHLPAILMWTTGVQGFDTLPDVPSKQIGRLEKYHRDSNGMTMDF